MLNSQHNPLVSILLPTHNRADVLHFAVCSVLAQTVQNFELLIVGDGCTDHTAEIVRSFDDSRIHWFDLPKGPAFGYANRNAVLQQARGELVAYMSHDDLWLSDHLERLLPFFEDDQIEIAFSRPLWVIPSGMIVPGIHNLNHTQTLNLFLNEKNWIPSDCTIHRRNCFFKYGYWDDTLPISADWDMWKRIIKDGEGKNFVYLRDGTCLHFKANWQDESYDKAFIFRFWRKLFTSNQMPPSLQVNVPDRVVEQKAVWDTMSSEPSNWNNEIRNAAVQALDVCALQGALLVESLLEFDEGFIDQPLQSDFSSDFGHSPFMERFRQLQVDQHILKDTRLELGNIQDELANVRNELADVQNELKNVQGTLTWKLHDHFANIHFIRRIYSMLRNKRR